MNRIASIDRLAVGLNEYCTAIKNGPVPHWLIWHRCGRLVRRGCRRWLRSGWGRRSRWIDEWGRRIRRRCRHRRNGLVFLHRRVRSRHGRGWWRFPRWRIHNRFIIGRFGCFADATIADPGIFITIDKINRSPAVNIFPGFLFNISKGNWLAFSENEDTFLSIAQRGGGVRAMR